MLAIQKKRKGRICLSDSGGSKPTDVEELTGGQKVLIRNRPDPAAVAQRCILPPLLVHHAETQQVTATGYQPP